MYIQWGVIGILFLLADNGWATVMREKRLVNEGSFYVGF